MTGTEAIPGGQQTPGVARRLACLVYEGVLLFGVLMAAALVYGVATDQRHALVGAFGLRVVLFLVLGAYFIGFWSRQGQTLAMRTWHIKLVRATNGNDLHPPSWARSAARYLLAWVWFVPALLALHLSGVKGTPAVFATLLAGVLTYALLARLHPERQFLHDALCGTRLVTWRPPLKRLAVTP